jgi:hypothetical protein
LIVSGISRPATSSVRVSGGAGLRTLRRGLDKSGNIGIFYMIRRNSGQRKTGT